MTTVTPRTSGILSEYTLWLIPAPSDAAKFQSVINDLASAHPPAPTFPPHITLLSKLPLTMPASAISGLAYDAIGAWQASSGISQSKTWEISLLEPVAGRSFFQSVYAPTEPAPELLALRKAMIEAFKSELPSGYVKREYVPHLSLYYGDVSDEFREEVREKAAAGLDVRKTEIARVAIVRLMGRTEEWEVVDSLALQTLA